MNLQELNRGAEAMVTPGRGILATDEPIDTIGKRLDNGVTQRGERTQSEDSRPRPPSRSDHSALLLYQSENLDVRWTIKHPNLVVPIITAMLFGITATIVFSKFW